MEANTHTIPYDTTHPPCSPDTSRPARRARAFAFNRSTTFCFSWRTAFIAAASFLSSWDRILRSNHFVVVVFSPSLVLLVWKTGSLWTVSPSP